METSVKSIDIITCMMHVKLNTLNNLSNKIIQIQRKLMDFAGFPRLSHSELLKFFQIYDQSKQAKAQFVRPIVHV